MSVSGIAGADRELKLGTALVGSVLVWTGGFSLISSGCGGQTASENAGGPSTNSRDEVSNDGGATRGTGGMDLGAIDAYQCAVPRCERSLRARLRDRELRLRSRAKIVQDRPRLR